MNNLRIIGFLWLLLSVPAIAQNEEWFGVASEGVAAAAGGGGASFAKVQQVLTNSTAATASITPKFASAPTSGNLLIMAVACDSTVTTPSGFTSDESAVNAIGLYIFRKVSNGSEQAVVVSPSSSASIVVQLFEYSGMAASTPFDTGASSNGVSNAACGTMIAGVTSQANELSFVCVGGHTGTASGVTWNNSFTALNDNKSTGSGANEELHTAFIKQTSTGSFNATATFTGGVIGTSPGGCIANYKITNP